MTPTALFDSRRSERYSKFTNRPGDIAAIVELCSNPELSLKTANMPHPYIHKDAMEWVASHGPDSNTFAIRDPVIVGCISYSRDHQIGYWIGTEFQGQGYATHALRWLISQDWCNKHLVWAAIRDANFGSRKVLERNGFMSTDETVTLNGSLRLNGIALTKYVLVHDSHDGSHTEYEPPAARERVWGGDPNQGGIRVR